MARRAYSEDEFQRLTGSRLVAASTETVTPFTTLGTDGEVLRIPVAARLDYHLGLRL